MSKILEWIDYRLPIFTYIKYFFAQKKPGNLNWLWSTGFLLTVGFIVQMITGLFLSMHYIPHAEYAFDSVRYIMTEVEHGWLIRYMHMYGAYMVFAVMYIHIFRGMYYGSYKKPRELLWIIGVFIFIITMVIGFTGYSLPWGQMSYWAANVITNLFSSMPFIGDSIGEYLSSSLRGGEGLGTHTLTRFFSLHYFLTFVTLLFVILHVMAVSAHGSNNPDGERLSSELKQVPMAYYTYKELIILGIYFVVYAVFIFFASEEFFNAGNMVPANNFVTPDNIHPEWYLAPFYAILKSFESKAFGVFALILSILIWFFVPFLDKSDIKSARYRPIYRVCCIVFLVNFIILGYTGLQDFSITTKIVNKISTLYYFLHFLIVLPFISWYELRFNKKI